MLKIFGKRFVLRLMRFTISSWPRFKVFHQKLSHLNRYPGC